MKCDECGAELKRESYIKTIRDGSKKRTVCPSCFQFIQHEKGNRLIKEFMFGLIMAVILVASTRQAWGFLNLYLFYFMCYLSIIPHELGHAFAVLLFRLKLLDMRIGQGRRIYSKKLLGIYLDFRAIPIEGSVRHLVTATPALRTKLFFIYSAGPLANIAIFILLLTVFGHAVKHESINNGPAPLLALAIANLFLGVWNLLPFRSQRLNGNVPRDGLGMIYALFSKKIDVNNESEQLIMQAHLAFKNKDYNTCEELSKKIIDLDKSNTLAHNLYAVAASNLGRLDEAIQVTQQTLNNADLSEDMRAIMESNITYYYLAKSDEAKYGKALELSAKAMQELPWELSVRNHCGCINIVAGDVAKGIKLLSDRRFAIKDKELRAEICCFLAIGKAKQGNIEQAKKEIEKARKLDSECIFLKRTEAEVLDE